MMIGGLGHILKLSTSPGIKPLASRSKIRPKPLWRRKAKVRRTLNKERKGNFPSSSFILQYLLSAFTLHPGSRREGRTGAAKGWESS